MTALAIDASGAGVALTQLSGRYVPPEVPSENICFKARVFRSDLLAKFAFKELRFGPNRKKLKIGNKNGPKRENESLKKGVMTTAHPHTLNQC